MRQVFALLVVSALVSAASAQAQTPLPRPERPYRGLFGGGVGNAEQLLKLNVSFAGGYDDDVLASARGETGEGSPFQSSPGGRFARGAATLVYSISRSKVTFDAASTVVTSFVPDAPQEFVTSYDGSVSGSGKLSKRTTVNGSYYASREPLYYFQPTFSEVFDLIFGEVVLYDQTLETIKQRRITTRGAGGISQSLTRRMTASAEFSSEGSTTSSHTGDFSRRTVGGRLSYSLAKGLGLHAGYGITKARNVGAENVGADDHLTLGRSIDAGVDFNKALSFSRKTTLSFGTGTSALDDGFQTHFVMTGNVRLIREIGRSWSFNTGYSRDVSYVDVIRDPLLSHSGTAGVSGLLSRKTQVTAALGASSGAAGFAGSNNDYRTYYGTVNVQYGLTRTLALSILYTRYQYVFEEGVSLVPGVPSRSDRQMVRASLEFWQSLFHRARRGNASR